MRFADLVLAFVVGASAVLFVSMGTRIRHLEHRVSCLEHPAGEASSTAIRMANGRFVVMQPPTVTRICRR